MSEDMKKILLENAQEYYVEGIETQKRRNYNSSVTLFFKSLAALSDLYILFKEGFVPKNHTERFRVLESKYLKIYKMNDEVFTFYQESYRTKLNKEISEITKKNVEKLFDLIKKIK